MLNEYYILPSRMNLLVNMLKEYYILPSRMNILVNMLKEYYLTITYKSSRQHVKGILPYLHVSMYGHRAFYQFQEQLVYFMILFVGEFGRNVKTEFCMKTSPTVSNYDTYWPEGAYCLLKKGDCPTGITLYYMFLYKQCPLLHRL